MWRREREQGIWLESDVLEPRPMMILKGHRLWNMGSCMRSWGVDNSVHDKAIEMNETFAHPMRDIYRNSMRYNE